MKSLLGIAILTALTGCASIVGSKTQSVSIATTASSGKTDGAVCTLQNDEGKWTVTSPASVVVHKSYGDLTVDCILQNGFGGNARSVSRANMAVWGNLLIGGALGYYIDYRTGAGFDYPSSIVVPLQTNGSAMPFAAAASGAPASVSAYMPAPTRAFAVPAGYVPRSTMAPE